MKASKESSSRLCLSGDVPPSAACWGVSGVAFLGLGPRAGFRWILVRRPPGVLASARSAKFARGAALARFAAEGRWRPSSHSVSGSWSLRFCVRLASGQCLVASVCRFVRRVGTLH